MLYGLLLLHTDGMHICRQQLASVVAGMSSLREKWQNDVQQVEELATVAGMILLDQWSCVPVTASDRVCDLWHQTYRLAVTFADT